LRIIAIEAAKKPRKPARGKYFLYPVAGARGSGQRKSVRFNHPVKSQAERENGPQEENSPPVRSMVVAVTAVAASYAYFLIFAQFGFLHALTAVFGEGHTLLRPVMAVMGLAGIAGSIATAKGWSEPRARAGMTAGFLLAGMAAGLAWVARTPPWFFAAAALTGAGTGMITVGLAALIRRETGGERLGLCLGFGTGSAYALCNLPPVFAAGPHIQAALGIAAAGTGLIAVRLFEQRAPVRAPRGADYEPRGIARWTLALLALVTFDSAAFYVIQHTPELKTAGWTDDRQLLINAAAHFASAVLAGWALDRRRMVGVILIATALLAAGSGLIFRGGGGSGATLYAAGVSVYSTVLVFYPARSGRVKLAALVYAVAGWTGSAWGIAMAEKLGWSRGWILVLIAVPGLLAFRRPNVQ
jgi:cytochrome c oxidase cbb3-type subunit 2